MNLSPALLANTTRRKKVKRNMMKWINNNMEKLGTTLRDSSKWMIKMQYMMLKRNQKKKRKRRRKKMGQI
jgi:hypothetical protein